MRNFDAKEHASRLKIARELVSSGLPMSWIAATLGINPRTVANSVKPSMQIKLSHGMNRFQTVMKNYTYRQLNARGEEAQQAKTLTEEWLGLDWITTMFRPLELFVNNLFVPSYLPDHDGYIALLKKVFPEQVPEY